jgi:hypothetical protein
MLLRYCVRELVTAKYQRIALREIRPNLVRFCQATKATSTNEDSNSNDESLNRCENCKVCSKSTRNIFVPYVPF